MQIQLENEPDRFGFDRVDVQFLLDLRAALLGLNHLVAERSRGSVPEPLTRVLLHGPDDVLGVLLGLVFVEQGNDLAHHCVHRFALIANRLGDGDDPDAMLGQLAKIEFLFERLAKEPAITVDEDQIERLLPIAGALDHLLEDGSAVIAGRRASFDELRNHACTLWRGTRTFNWRRWSGIERSCSA